MIRVLVTGGLGYIGSHTCVELLKAGFSVFIVDNLSNSKLSMFQEVRALYKGNVEFGRADLRNAAEIDSVLGDREFDAVIHFAALKSVPHSMDQPLAYYDNNVVGSINLFRAMERRQIRYLVFGSSAAVYGVPVHLPIDEAHPLSPLNPYGSSKAIVERIVEDIARAIPEFRYATLRYFNAVGAHPSGCIGDDPVQTSTNLMLSVIRVAAGELAGLKVYGGDFATPDGTCIRDYVHVVDLACAQVAALQYLLGRNLSVTVNLGTGRGFSVLELVRTFERVNGVRVPIDMVARRAGDAPVTYADVSCANKLLGWTANPDLERMCMDSWNWKRRAREHHRNELP